MADYESFRLAGLESPLPSSTANSLLQDADPPLYWFTQWVQAVIQTHVGPRWNAEVTAAGLPELVGKVVQATVPYDPVPVFTEAQFKLPLLAIYRVDSDFNEATTVWPRRTAGWHLDYILPPLSPAQLERLYPFTNAIEAAIYDRINQDHDPAVLSGQTLASLMQTEFIKVVQAKPSRDTLRSTKSQAGAANSVDFRLLHMRFEVGERKLPVVNPPWTGVDGTVSVVGGAYPPVDIAPFSKNNG